MREPLKFFDPRRHSYALPDADEHPSKTVVTLLTLPTGTPVCMAMEVLPPYVQTTRGSRVSFLGIRIEGAFQEHQPKKELSVRVAFEGPLVGFIPRSLHPTVFDEDGDYFSD